MSLRSVEELFKNGGKGLVFFLIISIIGTIVSLGIHLIFYSDRSDYVEVVALVTNTDRKSNVSIFSDDTDRQERFYATYKYEYNGVTYEQEAQMERLTSEIPGTETTILIDPDRPTRIDNGYGGRSAIIYVVIFAGLSVFFGAALIYQRINSHHVY